MKKNLLSVWIIICLMLGMSQTSLFASHYLGSEITYTCLSANQYEIRLAVYTDCSSIGSPNSLNVNLSSATCTNLSQALTLISGSPSEITPDCATTVSTCNGGTGQGIEVYEYTGVVTLTGGCDDWVVSYGSCCRNNFASNVVNPGSNSHYVEATLNNNLSSCNSSPAFIDDEPLKYGCVGDTMYSSFGAMDSDGDSLVYSLVDVLNGSNSPLTYNPGLSSGNPFYGLTTINSVTGAIKVLANTVHAGYIAVKVEEYRNGVKIGEVMREVVYYFSNCNNATPKITTVNSNAMPPNGVYSMSVVENTPISLSLASYDLEVLAGSQALSTSWQNAPANAVTTTGSAPTFSWTPTSNDVGRHIVLVNVKDDYCPIVGYNTYTVLIEVTAATVVNPTFASTVTGTLAAGATGIVCLDGSNLGALANATILSDSLNNATIQNIDLTTGCMTVKGDSIAIDTIIIVICDSLGACDTNTLILDVQQGVWPGDTDVDQQVNNLDLLNIGLGFATFGTPRQAPSLQWDGYITPDWNKFTAVTNINYKHVDCNGDGIINAADTMGIVTNWGNTYTYNNKGAGILGTIPLYVDVSTAPTVYQVQMPIILGSPNIPATNVYGIAFTIQYDTSLIKLNTADISINSSWLGMAGTDLISIHKDFYDNGVIQVAITRTDGIDVSGNGQIGSFDFTIQDDIMLNKGNSNFNFDVINVRMIDYSNTEIPVSPQATTLSITTNVENQYLDKLAKVYPNPAQTLINIEMDNVVIEDIIMRNLAGQVVKTQNVQRNQATVDVQGLPDGIYTISVITKEGILNKKVVILKK